MSNEPDNPQEAARKLEEKNRGMTHTARLMRTCLAADKMARETGIPRPECKTILGAALQQLSAEQRAQLAKELEDEDDQDVRDQT